MFTFIRFQFFLFIHLFVYYSFFLLFSQFSIILKKINKFYEIFMKHSWFATVNFRFWYIGTLYVKYKTTRLYDKIIMQIRYLTFVKRNWFTLPVNVWLKATTTFSNNYSVNFILKNNKLIIIITVMTMMIIMIIVKANKFPYWENDDFCWKLTMSESSLKFC